VLEPEKVFVIADLSEEDLADLEGTITPLPAF
jgi:hypothetical protein